MKMTIYNLLPLIVRGLVTNNVTIISTPTGSGKTLMVAPTLLACTGQKVWHTVPRVLLAKNAAEGMQSLILNHEYPVGVMTGKYNKNPHSQIQICTEGSFLNRAWPMMAIKDILVVDEVHEQGIGTEEILYLASIHASRGGKVVIMSATMDLTKFTSFFPDALVLEMEQPKRPFDTEIRIVSDPIKEVISLGGTTLWGCSGKDEIAKVNNNLKSAGYKEETFPIHAEIEEDDEAYALAYKNDCVYEATSVAMSGVTFPRLDNVVVPSVGKRVEKGVLKEYNLSIAEQKQWEGRVGRTKNGVAIYGLVSANKDIREINVSPEILRADIRSVVLSFNVKGYDMEFIKLLNQPEMKDILAAKKWLSDNGLWNTKKGIEVASIGGSIEESLLIWNGIQLGIELTARKIVSVVSNSSPFRKTVNSFNRMLVRNCPICAISDHYRVVKAVEEDQESIFEKGVSSELVKKYCEDNNIFMKGMNRIRREFTYLEKDYADSKDISVELIQTLFAGMPVEQKFEHGSNSFIGSVTGSTGSTAYGIKIYASLTPVQTRRGRLYEMATVLV